MPNVLNPDWFTQAVAHPHTSHAVEVEGASIHYLRWQGPTEVRRRGLLFVHGGGAHARWWQFIAPFFAEHFDVVALDLSGMGESGHREAYRSKQRARELRAVMQDANFGEDAIVVGHSLGGFVGIRHAHRYGGEIAGLVIVDSPVMPPGQPFSDPPPQLKPHKTYPTEEVALSRFRVLPSQPCENDYLLDFIARHSIHEVAGGWQWKFDRIAMGPPAFGQKYRDELAELACPGAFIYGAKSALVSEETAAYMAGLMGPGTPVLAIPDAYHHVMLDQPLAFVSGLRAMLAMWPR